VSTRRYQAPIDLRGWGVAAPAGFDFARKSKSKAATASRTADGPPAYTPQAPTPAQAAFLALDAREALYGGAAGGGKSSALLMAALQHVDTPGYAALLLRRTYADLSLPGALMDRAREWLSGTDARWEAQTKTWHFPSGASLTFGYLENENDRYRYQGAEFQFVGFDEVTQFSEAQYTYLASRLRRPEGMAVPLRLRAASNPGGVGHQWVYDRFVAQPDAARPYVPARLGDNPHLDHASYLESLALLDGVTRAQLLDGDWTVTRGLLFQRQWFRIVDAAPAATGWARYWDLAASTKTSADYTACAAVALHEGTLYIRDMVRGRWEWPDQRRIIVQTMRAEQATRHGIEEALHGLAAVQELRRLPEVAGITLRGISPEKDKVSRALPWATRAEAGQVVLVRGPWVAGFLDEVCSFDGSGKGHDDQVDTVSGGVAMLARGPSSAVGAFG
jgi:predicted phage terminase large subunit-like protein